MSEDRIDRRAGDERMDRVERALDELKNKQVRPLSVLIWAPLVIWIVGATVTGVWWAATLTAELSALADVVTSATEDRYKESQARSDFKLRDLRDTQQDKEIAENSRKLEELRVKK